MASYGVAVADIKNDREQDLIVLTPFSPGLWVGLANGEAAFKSAVSFDWPAFINQTSWANPTAGLAVSDFNDDGKLDLAEANGTDVSVLLNESLPLELELSIEQRDGGQVTVSWPSLFSGAVLLSTAALHPADWQPVPEGPVEHYGRWQTTIQASSGSRWFRLRRGLD
ncbi:MAG: VCBS repeat-containing protein [Verrucomicrobiota bacterium]